MLPKPDTNAGAFFELVAVVALAVGLALLGQAFVVKPYVIPTPSMVPTIIEGQRVLANRFIYRFSDPDVGDIIVFHPPADESCGRQPPAGQVCAVPGAEPDSQNFIKRVVAVPGDRLYIKNGHPVVNGKMPDEPFARDCAGGNTPCNYPREIVIPEDHYFMMGDNRGDSQDSRIWGPVDRDEIIGQAFFTYWPFDRIGFF